MVALNIFISVFDAVKEILTNRRILVGLENDIKSVEWDVERPEKPKKKVIIFEEFRRLKGASFWYRLKALRWDVRDIFHRMVYGYEPTAVFAMDTVFIERYLEIMKQFKYGWSYPGEMSYKEWQKIIQSMIDYLEILAANEPSFFKEDGSYDKEKHAKYGAERMRTKEEFFELFSLFFFDMWD